MTAEESAVFGEVPVVVVLELDLLELLVPLDVFVFSLSEVVVSAVGSFATTISTGEKDVKVAIHLVALRQPSVIGKWLVGLL